MSTVRTFIAVEASEGVRSRAVALIERLRVSEAKVGWVKPENMHWTLKFLGDVDMNRTAEICTRVAKAVAESPPFEVDVQGAGAFPNTARPRTIWLGVSRGHGEMTALHQKTDEALSQMRFAREGRRYTPHLTIGRVRGPENITELGRLIEKRAGHQGGTTFVDEVVIFASYLHREGAVHEVLGRAPLGG